jgi:hypothetical protein
MLPLQIHGGVSIQDLRHREGERIGHLEFEQLFFTIWPDGSSGGSVLTDEFPEGFEHGQVTGKSKDKLSPFAGFRLAQPAIAVHGAAPEIHLQLFWNPSG